VVAAVGPDTAVAVAPEDAPTTWDDPTVVIASLAVSANGTVTVDATAAATLRMERGVELRADTTTAAGWYEALRLGRPEQSAITHPGGRLLFGLHGNRSFYFGDIDGGSLKKYVMKIDGGTGDVGIGSGDDKPGARLEVRGGGGTSVDLLVNGRLRSNSNDGGLWVGTDRFVGGASINSTNHVGFFTNNAWRLTVLAELLNDLELERGLSAGAVGLLALIELPAALPRLEAITASRRLVGLAFGSEDFSAALGAAPVPAALAAACQQVAYAAAARGVMALGSPASIGEFRDLRAWRAGLDQARAMGMSGALCVHPDQIADANAAFEPSEEEVIQAQAILKAWAQADAGATALGGKMIDAPVVARAQRVLAARRG